MGLQRPLPFLMKGQSFHSYFCLFFDQKNPQFFIQLHTRDGQTLLMHEFGRANIQVKCVQILAKLFISRAGKMRLANTYSYSMLML